MSEVLIVGSGGAGIHPAALTTRKLIAGYEEKINNCDTVLNSYKQERREYRHSAKDVPPSLHRDTARVGAQRQAYTQAIADLESILDCF